VRIHGYAAAIIGDRDRAVFQHLDIDEAGMAGHGLVHRIVDHLGEEVVQGALIGAADIHARPPAHRLQTFEHLDRRGVVAGLGERAVARRLGLFAHRPGGARRYGARFRPGLHRQRPVRIRAEKIAILRHRQTAPDSQLRRLAQTHRSCAAPLAISPIRLRKKAEEPQFSAARRAVAPPS
jgi:hypothetical protein